MLLVLYVLLCSPLLGFLTLTFLPHKYKDAAPLLSRILLFFSFALAAFLLYKNPSGFGTLSKDFVWVGFSNIEFGIFVSWGELLMLFLVNLIALVVSIFSETYMQNDAGKKRYFAFLQLFVLAMLMLVVSSNLLQTYIFWELVGFVSYLLIGFWREKPEAIRASRKAFLTNRLGDIGFLIGIALIFSYTNELSFGGIQSAVFAGKIPTPALSIIGICIFLGAMAKSAQFPLHIWLPDAMQGPTPISALLHAATMVAAGVFLSAKIIFLFDNDARLFIAIIGGASMLLGAYKAIFERDIKKVLAYSTISQLGLMMLAIGVGSAEAAFLHLLTHAFFKAALFLCVGAILDYLHDLEKKHSIHADFQDMHLLGGLRKPMPLVFVVYTLSMFSLIGLPFFSGFLSKEFIFVSIWQQSQSESLYWALFVAALFSTFLTGFYIAKQWFLVFFGAFRLTQQFPQINLEKARTTWQYVVSLCILGLFTFGFAFSLTNPLDLNSNIWLDISAEKVSHNPVFIPFLAAFLGLSGLFFGFWRKTATLFSSILAMSFWFKPLNSFFSRFVLLVSQSLYRSWQRQKATLGVVFWLTSPVLWFAGKMSALEKTFSNFLDNIARTKVVLAHIVSWLDKAFVDGFIHFLIYLGKSFGDMFRNLQGKNIQSYFSFVIFFLLLSILTYILL